MPVKQADKQHTFVIPDDQSIPAIISLLQKTSSVRLVEESVFHRVFYDTFDWRLTRNGSALEVHDDGLSSGHSSGQTSGLNGSQSNGKIYWRADKESRLKIQLGLKNVPRLAADLPACEFRQQLHSVISVRELSPRLKIRIKRHSLAVLNKQKKTVVRLNFDVYWHNPSKLRAAKVLTKRLTIKSVKGYIDNYQGCKAFFSDIALPKSQARPLPTLLKTAQDNAMNLALIASGVNTAEYSTSLKLRLDPDMPGDQAAKIILLRLLEILQQNTAGCIRGKDTEFMQDYRVVLTKICILLTQLKLRHPQPIGDEYRQFFSKLGELTSPVREFDIFLMQLSNNPDRFQLQPLRDYLLRLRKLPQNTLIEEFKSSRYRETIKQWRKHLENSSEENIQAENDGVTLYKLADDLLRNFNQTILKLGDRLTDNSDAELLDELRENCKKLCYSMELFSSLYPAKELRVMTGLLKEILDNLNILHDLNIQTGMVQEFVKQSKNEDAVTASEQLIRNFERQKDEAGKKLIDAYSAYASSASQKKVKELFVNYRRGIMKL